MYQLLLPAIGLGAQLLGSALTKGQQQPSVDIYGPGGPLDQERQRQAAFQAQADAVTGREIGRFDNFQGQMDDKAKSVADFFAAHNSALPANGGPTAGAMPVSHSQAVLADAAPKMQKVFDYNTQQNDALSKMRSFGDVMGDVSRGLMGDRSQLANIENFRAASRAIVPVEMSGLQDRAQRSMVQPSNTFADLLKGAGGIATMAGLSGAFGSFGGGGSFVGTPQGLSTYGSPGYAASNFFGGPK